MSNSKKSINICRWVTRIVSIIIVGIFLLFFIGEGFIPNIPKLTTTEFLLIICIPVLFTTGVVIAWKKEIVGGIIIISSILLFNIIDIIKSPKPKIEIEFGILLLVGIMYIVCGIDNLKKRVYK